MSETKAVERPWNERRGNFGPRTPEMRAKLIAAHEKRLGLKPGFRRVFDIEMPKALADKIRPEAQRLRRLCLAAGNDTALYLFLTGAVKEYDKMLRAKLDAAHGAIRKEPAEVVPTITGKTRRCLGCGISFQSVGIGNRMCDKCAGRDVSPFAETGPQPQV